MAFAGMNYAAIVVAAIAGFVAGAVWYGLLGKQWMAVLGKSKDEMKPSPGPFITAGVALLLMAYVLAGTIGHLGEVNLRTGVISGAIIWAGFVATTIAVNNAFQGARLSLSLIDAGHWLVVLLLMGGVIGAFGV
ncbi:MAG TPA: DUF1761 domain-containing protein [Hyphomicrobiales bacterium]|nr:DUF1761 domain-containing protein [Hyphomicrobiales bacterium]